MIRSVTTVSVLLTLAIAPFANGFVQPIPSTQRRCSSFSATKRLRANVDPKNEIQDVEEMVLYVKEQLTTMTTKNGSTSAKASSDLLDRLELFREQETEAVPSNVDPLGGLLWRGVVVILCALWASNFAAAKLVMAEPGVDSSLYAVTRFAVAALALAPFALSSVRRSGIDAETVKGALFCGSWVAFGYLGQLLGLLTTTASRSCVICSLHCVFVAVVAELLRVSRSNANFNTERLLPAAVAVAGVAIVELQGAAGAPTIGDALSFAQPIGFGMGYLQLEELMKRRPDAALPVSALKLTVVALASLAMFELGPLLSSAETWAPRIPDFGAIFSSPIALGGVLYTGLITTALALWVESIAFARVPATDASIILTTEPLFAALFGAISLGETFGASDYVGASLIIGACVIATLMDNPGDEKCVIEKDPSCKPPRRWPFWGF